MAGLSLVVVVVTWHCCDIVKLACVTSNWIWQPTKRCIDCISTPSPHPRRQTSQPCGQFASSANTSIFVSIFPCVNNGNGQARSWTQPRSCACLSEVVPVHRWHKHGWNFQATAPGDATLSLATRHRGTAQRCHRPAHCRLNSSTMVPTFACDVNEPFAMRRDLLNEVSPLNILT